MNSDSHPPSAPLDIQPPPYGALSPQQATHGDIQKQAYPTLQVHSGGPLPAPYPHQTYSGGPVPAPYPHQTYSGGPVPAPYPHQTYSGAQQQQQPVINVQPSQPEVIVVQNPVFGSEPQNARCPHCHTEMFTRTETAITPMTHIVFILCCLFGCFCCAPFAYCTDSCTEKKHYCSRCNHYLGQSQ
ncbi:lipopolysaccharide-induced tumor necrosis factor-alpha factor homolog [Copidosoma floridanum]|uniref:lipopolysaccharide-induced tumor necrosis factor-alpha factor homolog n=1 Tax=Copidosoma floridanum TaxID=29053 RepID=UPI0006C99E92|nr:lipopolysaccharide-induced tumor necrosis factor-alpha factor homolog [Copidosoma floridanum]